MDSTTKILWQKARAGDRANMLFKNLELDFSELEKEVVVEGKTVELRPIRARLRD